MLHVRIMDVLEQPAVNEPEPDEFDKVNLEDGQLHDDVLDLHASTLSESGDDGLASVAKVPISTEASSDTNTNNIDNKVCKDDDMGFATKYTTLPPI